MNEQHLWEAEHSYYYSDSNYTKNGCRADYESWTSFMAESGDIDPDYNLLFRWDWNAETDDNGDVTSDGRGGKYPQALLDAAAAWAFHDRPCVSGT